MKTENFGDTLSLDSYLKSKMVVAHTHGFTFARTLPRTLDLPEVTVGLSALYLNTYDMQYRATSVPSPLSGDFASSLIIAVKEKREKLSHFPNWQERLLLDLGYARSLLPDIATTWDAPKDFKLFEVIPEEEKGFLLERHGFHKIAMMVAYGRAQNIDEELLVIDDLRIEANYGDILRLLSRGIPMDDLALALQLPEPMVWEFYQDGSGEA